MFTFAFQACLRSTIHDMHNSVISGRQESVVVYVKVPPLCCDGLQQQQQQLQMSQSVDDVSDILDVDAMAGMTEEEKTRARHIHKRRSVHCIPVPHTCHRDVRSITRLDFNGIKGNT